jgi:hypothetical protein
MANCNAQPDLADALALVLRAQLSATSDALTGSLRCWSLLWTQMLARPATVDRPVPAQTWPIPGPIPGLIPGPILGPLFRPDLWTDLWPVLWPVFWPGLWPIPRPMHRSMAWLSSWPMNWPSPWPSPWLSLEPWQEGTGDRTRLGFFPLAPIWWTAGRAVWAPSAGTGAGKACQLAAPYRLRPSVAEPPAAAHATAGLDASFASYRSAGGHALAQVIVPPSEELAEATARAWRSPLDALLGVWRAALGV